MREAARSSTTDIQRLADIAECLAERMDWTFTQAVDRMEAYIGMFQPIMPMATAIRTLQRARARRNEILDVDLFRDPAWDMLLELVSARLHGRAVTVSTLCVASGVPATTALRHVDRMAEEGLIVRMGDHADHRRVLVEIAPGMIGKVEALVADFCALVWRQLGGDDRRSPPPVAIVRPPA